MQGVWVYSKDGVVHVSIAYGCSVLGCTGKGSRYHFLEHRMTYYVKEVFGSL
jgi:hypothetical protein